MNFHGPIVLSSANPDKAAEIREILEGIDLLQRPAEVPDVEENGDSLEANARLKAVTLVKATGHTAIADDTGLEVDALSGAPGVYSARYSGPNATYESNVQKLLEELDGVPYRNRTAKFRTVALLHDVDGHELIAEGVVKGHIALAPKGEGGFGYDVVFVPLEGGGRTFAEMEAAEKHAISHRGRAFRHLRDLMGGN
jgi:XTP/dITP diphosphohydrolase